MLKVSPRVLIQAVSKCWQALESVFDTPTEWRQFSEQLLKKLREFDDIGADHLTIVGEIVASFAKFQKAQTLLVAALAEEKGETVAEPAGDRGLRSPFAPEKPDVDLKGTPRLQVEERAGDAIVEIPVRHAVINVLFGTDRVPIISLVHNIQYSAERADELSFGIATVSVPDDHRKGCLERPRWYRLEFRENPEKHVVISGVRPLARTEFVAEAMEARNRDGSCDEALIFVHGYNVSFDESIRRTAQLACDLEFKGGAIAYCWPSEGSLIGYGADANAIDSSVFLFTEFVKLVQTEFGHRRVHIIAHSIGSQLLAKAMDRLALAPTIGDVAEINQIIFAAPDIDPKTFERLARDFGKNCERCTLYASSKDMALFTSRLIHHVSRAGDTSSNITIVRRVDTIDASDVDTSVGMRHSYFGDCRTIIADMFLLFQNGWGPELRFGLEKITTDAGQYWAFKR
jgi:esterase/lipase superfamily enzyme